LALLAFLGPAASNGAAPGILHAADVPPVSLPERRSKWRMTIIDAKAHDADRHAGITQSAPHSGLRNLLPSRPSILSTSWRKRCQQLPYQETLGFEIGGTKLAISRDYVSSVKTNTDDLLDPRFDLCTQTPGTFVPVKRIAFVNAYTLAPVPAIMQTYFPVLFKLRADIPEYVESFSSLGPGTDFNDEFKIINLAGGQASYLIARTYTFPNGRPFAWHCYGFQLREKNEEPIRCKTATTFTTRSLFLTKSICERLIFSKREQQLFQWSFGSTPISVFANSCFHS
jgi:hypothetical protein